MKWIIAAAAGLAATALALIVRAQTSGKAVGGTSGATGAGRVYVAGRRLYGPGGVSVPLTAADKLWAGRMVVGETSGNDRRAGAATLWAIAQNLMLIIGSGSARPRFSTLTDCLRAYSQPISPRWESATSSGCVERPSLCTAAMLERRARIRTMAWESLPATTRQLVDDFFAGRLENPVPDMVDFAAASFDGARVNIGGNWFGTGANRRVV